MPAPALVCIVNQASQHVVEEDRLLAAGAKVRSSSSSPCCDLLFSRSGVTLAFLLLSQADVVAGGGQAVTARLELLAKSFKHGYVLMPFEAHASMAPIAAQYAHEASLSFVQMPMCASFTAQTLAITQAVLEACSEQSAWHQQQEQVVTTAEAVEQVLATLPLPHDCDRAHCAHMLRMLGSLQQLSKAGAAHIAAHTDLPLHATQQLESFFCNGNSQPSATARPMAAAHMPTLAMLRRL